MHHAMSHDPAATTVLPDDALVRAVRAGDVSAYGALVDRYQHAYMRFAVRTLGCREDADEALQSAFLRAFRALDQCHHPERFGSWLYQIVINECRTLATRRSRRERRFIRVDGETDGAVAVDALPQPADAADVREEIEYALAQLPADQREAFVLKHVEELSYEEMAELTGVNVSALKMRVKRACEKLRGLLEEAYYV